MLTFDIQKNPKQAYISMALLLAALIIVPFAAAPFGNSWVRIADLALLLSRFGAVCS